MAPWSGHPLDAEVYWDPAPGRTPQGLQGVPLGFWAELEEENQVESERPDGREDSEGVQSPLKRPAVHLPLDKGARGA